MRMTKKTTTQSRELSKGLRPGGGIDQVHEEGPLVFLARHEVEECRNFLVFAHHAVQGTAGAAPLGVPVPELMEDLEWDQYDLHQARLLPSPAPRELRRSGATRAAEARRQHPAGPARQAKGHPEKGDYSEDTRS